MKKPNLRFVALCAGLLAVPAAMATTYTYYGNGRVKSVTYDNGFKIRYTYDSAGNRTQVANNPAAGPTAGTVTQSISTGTPSITFDPRTSSSAPNGDAMTINSPVYGAVFGTVTVNSGTSVTYTPTFPMTVAALQKEALSYTVKDTVTGLSSDPATINISINDTAPTAAAFTVSPALPRNQLSTISALSHATSPGNETMTITGVTAATHGSTAITSDMTGVTYTPVAGYAGADSFTYKVTDVLGVASTSGSISLTVTSVNNAPVANGHGYMLNLDNTNYIDFNIGTTGSSGQVLLNDYDPDNDPIFLTSVSNVTGYVVASVISSTVIEIGCTATLGQGSFTYTISDGFTTSSATITGQCKTGTGTQ